MDTDKQGKFVIHSIVEQILSEHRFARDASGCLYRWEQDKGHWVSFSPERIRSIAYSKEIKESHSNPKRRATIASDIIDHPTVQCGDIKWNRLKPSEVPHKDCVLDIATGQTREHSPDDFLDYVLPHEYSPGARCPTWLQCLNEWFSDLGDCDDVIGALQQFFGYCVLPHAKYKKALYLRGEGDTGKSVVEHVLRRLVGFENCTSIVPDKMGDPRAIATIKGKLINLVSELSEDAMVDDGGFKKLVSSEDAVLIDPKFERPFFYSPVCKHVICSNNLPRITDHSKATYNRLLIIPMDKVIPRADQDPMLPQKLEREIQGILNWAIAGARRLMAANGKWSIPGTSIIEVENLAFDNNPVAQFVEEKCEPAINGWITVSDFAYQFNRWHEGRDWTKKTISQRLSKLGYKSGRDCKQRKYLGINWRDTDGIDDGPSQKDFWS